MKDNDFDINKLHQVQYEILVEFDRICRKYNLKYYLGFGSMLGAIRHEGFIPWDDDIDILMMYSELEKLKTIASNEWKQGYFLQSPETDKEYNRCFVKIRNSNTTLIVDDFADKDVNQGIAIDVEPLVSLADDLNNRRTQYIDTQLYMLFRVDEPPVNHGVIVNLASKMILGVIPSSIKKKLMNYYLNRILKYEKEETKYLYVINGNVEMMRDLHERDIFDDVVMKKFEKGLFPVPKGYDKWLSTRYGNYMELPPIEQQGIKLEHFLKIDTDNPYTKYKGSVYCTKQS